MTAAAENFNLETTVEPAPQTRAQEEIARDTRETARHLTSVPLGEEANVDTPLDQDFKIESLVKFNGHIGKVMSIIGKEKIFKDNPELIKGREGNSLIFFYEEGEEGPGKMREVETSLLEFYKNPEDKNRGDEK